MIRSTATSRAGETPPRAPTPGSEGPSSLRHEWVPWIARGYEVLFDRPRAGPTDQVEQATRLVVRSAGPTAAERLLAHHRTGRLVVEVEVSRGVAQRRTRLSQHRAILREDAARECVRRRAIDQLERLFPLFVGIHIEREHRPEDLFAHRPVTRVVDLHERRVHEVAVCIVAFAAEQHLHLWIALRAVDVAFDLVERFAIDHGAHEVAEISRIADARGGEHREYAFAQLGPE